MIDGQVLAICIADVRKAPMQPVHEVQAVVGQGLVGDRYSVGKGKYPAAEDGSILAKREVTLIEAEALAAVEAESGKVFTHEQTRRNLLTQDVALNHLVGKSFAVGEVEMRGIELCEPCAYLEAMYPGIMQPLIHRGGLRAQVVRGGTIRVGDQVQVLFG